MNENAKKLAEEIITFFEGKKLVVYPDSTGLPTVGIGHLVGKKDNLKIGDSITEDKCTQFFNDDIANADVRVQGNIHTAMNDNEYACLLSQAYNLRSFEKLATYFNKDKELYKSKMLEYCRAGKDVINGLLIRRICERLLFEGKEWKTVATDLQSRRNITYTTMAQTKLFG